MTAYKKDEKGRLIPTKNNKIGIRTLAEDDNFFRQHFTKTDENGNYEFRNDIDANDIKQWISSIILIQPTEIDIDPAFMTRLEPIPLPDEEAVLQKLITENAKKYKLNSDAASFEKKDK